MSPIFNVLINRIISIDEINEIYNCYNEFYNLWYKNIFARLQFRMTPIKMKLNKFEDKRMIDGKYKISGMHAFLKIQIISCIKNDG